MEVFSKQHHDCVTLMKQVMLLLDGEMNEQQEKDFMENICQCTHCFESLQIEKAFKDCVCNGLPRKSIPTNVLNSIRAQIKTQLDG